MARISGPPEVIYQVMRELEARGNFTGTLRFEAGTLVLYGITL